MKGNLPSYSYLKKEYETAKSLGSPALACNAVLVPKGHEHLRLLIQNFPRPMVTNNDPADVDYAGGLQAHRTGTPKTNFEGSLTVIETEKGAMAKFAQAMVDAGGELESCRVFFNLSDGATNSGTIEYVIYDVAFTFPDGGGEIDASSRSQILTVSGSIRYMYFGENANLGSTGTNAFNTINSSLNSGSSNIGNAIGNALSSLLGASSSVGVSGFGGGTATTFGG